MLWLGSCGVWFFFFLLLFFIGLFLLFLCGDESVLVKQNLCV